MAITLDDLRRAGIGTNGMNPNVIQNSDLSIRGLPQDTPALPPPPQPRRGLLGGFFGPEGRDARARLAIGLEGLTMNPNQALIGQLQGGIEERKMEAERNRTLEWLSKLNTPEATRALQYAQATGDIVGAAKIAIASPEANRGLVVGKNVVDAITGEIIYKGPDEAVDANIPAAFVAMDLQARAAGFIPKAEGGDGKYEEFMATRGAGFAAQATAQGTILGQAIASAPQEVSQADTTLGYINELRNHPGLEVGTGATSLGNVVIGTPGYDFQTRLNQLLAGGFLTAIDQLRGMGSLSNAEGQTATRAISRMDSATSTPEFLAALDDYENIVKLGRERATARIAPPASATVQPTLTYNPATGAFE